MALMTKKHYEVIAKIIKDAKVEPNARNTMANVMASGLKDTNPQFNRERFVKACELN